jgi:hypothetical protein
MIKVLYSYKTLFEMKMKPFPLSFAVFSLMELCASYLLHSILDIDEVDFNYIGMEFLIEYDVK